MYVKKFFLSIAACVALSSLQANNIQVSNISVQNRNTTTKTTMIHFDVSWENSWRTSSLESNWDAAWVFVKFKKKGLNYWQHATLDVSGHTAPTGGDLDATSDGKGAFIKASANMALSNVNYQGIELKWKYGTDGLNDQDSAEICVYGIEMVYVPQGSFYLGDGVGGSSFIYNYTTLGDPMSSAYNITSENSITDLACVVSSYGDIPVSTASSSVTIPADYPKGYQGFYCMKYEISQGQYVAFLNKLTSVQAANRNLGGGSSRNNITGTWPNFSTITPHIACDNMSIMDGSAYADWSGLRPMSEMEYEKACRGTLAPVTGEYAWGNTNINYPSSGATITNDGMVNETVAGANANVGGNLSGPLRCGWAGASPATRENTGCTYYGIANMSDNLFEMVISPTNSNGRTFSSSDHGDGSLSSTGDHTNTTWATTTSCYVRKGGAYLYSSLTNVQVSGRFSVTGTRSVMEGFRCVRTY